MALTEGKPPLSPKIQVVAKGSKIASGRPVLTIIIALVMIVAACGSVEKRAPNASRTFPAASIDRIKPISGTFFNFQWPDERYKYMNERQAAFTCDEWAIKISEMSEIGIQYIVLQSVAMQGRAFYKSERMPGAGLVCDDPLGTVMRAAEKLGIEVFLSCEFVKNEDDDICDPQLMQGRLDIMREIAARFGASKAFFGWYLASEGDASDLFDPRYVEYVNRLAAEARKLTPEAKILIAPSRSRYIEWNDDFPRQLKSMDIDIIAYQDKVACFPYLDPLGASRTQFALARSMYDRVPRITLWADIETFTWEGKNYSRLSALVPAPFPRVLEQMAAVSPYVDKIVAFTMQGMADKPGSPAPIGHQTAAELYRQYKRFVDREPDMVVLADAISGQVRHAAIGARVILKSNAKIKNTGFKLVDGGTASIYSRQNGWVEFKDGAMDIIVDLGRDMKLDYIGIDLLADRWNKVFLPQKVSFSVSLDETEYASIGSVEPYRWCPTAYDVRREIVTAPPVEMKARYVRIESHGLLVPNGVAPAGATILVSEIIVNPEMHSVRANGSAIAPPTPVGLGFDSPAVRFLLPRQQLRQILEHVLSRYNLDLALMHSPASQIHKVCLRHRIIVQEGFQPAEHGRSGSCRSLYLECMQPPRSVENEVYLATVRGSPVVDTVAEVEGAIERLELLQKKRFERDPFDLFGRIQRPHGSQCSVNARIEKIELGMDGETPLRSSRENGYSICDHKILDDRKIAFDGLPLDMAFTRDGGDIQHGSLREARRLEKPCECREISRQSFLPDLLFEVRSHIRLEIFPGVFFPVGGGHLAILERTLEVEILADLRNGQGMHGERQRSSGEEVRPFPSQLARARTGQNKMESPGFDKPMNLMQKVGNPLNLVDNDPAPEVMGNEVAEALRIRRQIVEKLRFQQIDIDRIGESGSDPRGFSRPPRTEQKEALSRRRIYQSGIHNSILHVNLELSRQF